MGALARQVMAHAAIIIAIYDTTHMHVRAYIDLMQPL